MDFTIPLVILISGLLWALVYTLVALGLVLMTGVAKMINFAHGAYILFASYCTLSLFRIGINPFLAPIVIVPAFFVFGVLLQLPFRALYRLKLSLAEFQLTALIITFGISVIVDNTDLSVWGYNTQFILLKETGAVIGVLGLSIPTLLLYSAIIGGAASLALRTFMLRTTLGSAVRVTGEDVELASLVGIDTRFTTTLIYGLHAALCGLSGVLLSMLLAFYPGADTTYLLTAFAIMVLGGLGSVEGTLIAAIILQLVSGYVGFYFNADLGPVSVMLALVIVLLVRPQGLFGRRLS